MDVDPLRPEDPSPGNYVAIAVSDNGMGIADDVLPHIFEPIFSTKESGKGSGLGLAQVFGIAKQSGGGVGVETRIGEGTTLTVFFPSAEMLPFVEKSDTLPAIAARSTSTAHILVVDDDKDVLIPCVIFNRSASACSVPKVEAKLFGSLLAIRRSICFSPISPCRK